ncbi:MAG TPA: hypothetical protein VFF73_08635 [Planctomycetota bacterium]|nr:hypothetical protein [Planctomycetota bacterium]
MNEPKERLVAHALFIGAAKGAVAGLLLAIVPASVLYSPAGGPKVPLQVLAGGALGVASFCGLDAASARVEVASQRLLLRFCGGFVVPFALAAPKAGILEIDPQVWSHGALLAMVIAGLLLGAGLVVAGPPTDGPHEPQSFGRLFVALLTASSPMLLLSVVGGSPACGGAIVFAGMGTILLRLGELVGGLVAARWIALWLEPEVVWERDGRARTPGVLAQVGDLLRLGAYAEALDRIDRIDLGAVDEKYRTQHPTVFDRRAEALLGLGRLDEAEQLADRVSFPPALRAELARRRGDLDGAEALVRAWLDELGSTRDVPPRVTSGRASAHAILALVRADRGRLDDARAALAVASASPEWYPRAFEYLSPRAVERYLAERSRV